MCVQMQQSAPHMLEFFVTQYYDAVPCFYSFVTQMADSHEFLRTVAVVWSCDGSTQGCPWGGICLGGLPQYQDSTV